MATKQTPKQTKPSSVKDLPAKSAKDVTGAVGKGFGALGYFVHIPQGIPVPPLPPKTKP